MSHLGHKRKSSVGLGMSAVPLEADLPGGVAEGPFVTQMRHSYLDVFTQFIHELDRLENTDTTFIRYLYHLCVACYQRAIVDLRHSDEDVIPTLDVWDVNHCVPVDEPLVYVNQLNRIVHPAGKQWAHKSLFRDEPLERALHFEPPVRWHGDLQISSE